MIIDFLFIHMFVCYIYIKIPYKYITCIWNTYVFTHFMRTKCKWTIVCCWRFWSFQPLLQAMFRGSDLGRNQVAQVWGRFFGEYVYIWSLGNWHSQWRGFMLNRNDIFKWFIVSLPECMTTVLVRIPSFTNYSVGMDSKTQGDVCHLGKRTNFQGVFLTTTI